MQTLPAPGFIACFARRLRAGRLFRGLCLAVLMATGVAPAQFGPPPATQLHDTSALHPPAGARVAIVEFADLECPACAHADPILKQAAAKYKIPWVRHDFLIPYHTWSHKAAVNARWFDGKSQALGDEYRDQVFANQNLIYNLGMLSMFTQNFAKTHGITLPFDIDPQNKLDTEVQADCDLGKRMGLTVTPTIFIVTAGSQGAPFIEVHNPEQDLDQDLDQAMAATRR